MCVSLCQREQSPHSPVSVVKKYTLPCCCVTWVKDLSVYTQPSESDKHKQRSVTTWPVPSYTTWAFRLKQDWEDLTGAMYNNSTHMAAVEWKPCFSKMSTLQELRKVTVCYASWKYSTFLTVNAYEFLQRFHQTALPILLFIQPFFSPNKQMSTLN